MRERERGAGRRGDVQGGQSNEKGTRRWRRRGHGRLWRGHAAAWSRGMKTIEEESRWAGLANWAGQAAQEWAAEGGKRQVSLFSLLFLFLFLFSIFLTYVLI